MRVLVTGPSGYLGIVMVTIQQAAGHGVTGLESRVFRRGEATTTFEATRQED
jgi:hypothetical protein